MVAMKIIPKKIAVFLRMPLKKKAMFLVNVMLCGMARALINLFPLRYLTPYLGTFGRITTVSTLISAKQMDQARQISKSVVLASRYTPWDSSCLTQAMVAKFWCWLYNIPYALYIGVCKSAEEPSGYKAHAWLTAGPVAITGGDSWSEFQVVSSYFSTAIALKNG
jgi:hypothetical protein